MGIQAFHRGGYEHPTGEEAIPRYGGGAGRDQRKVGSGAKTVYRAHQGSPQGLGDGGS